MVPQGAGDDGEGEVEVGEEGREAEEREVEGVRVVLVAGPVGVAPPLERLRGKEIIDILKGILMNGEIELQTWQHCNNRTNVFLLVFGRVPEQVR